MPERVAELYDCVISLKKTSTHSGGCYCGRWWTDLEELKESKFFD